MTRWSVEDHAVDRYLERHAPGMSFDDARALLIEHLPRAVLRKTRSKARGGGQLWDVPGIGVTVVGKPENGRQVAVTVLPKGDPTVRGGTWDRATLRQAAVDHLAALEAETRERQALEAETRERQALDVRDYAERKAMAKRKIAALNLELSIVRDLIRIADDYADRHLAPRAFALLVREIAGGRSLREALHTVGESVGHDEVERLVRTLAEEGV